MKKYLSFFRMRFIHGLQYRTAAFSGIITQFAWGFMEILLFRAFYAAGADAFPMSFQALVNYTWLQQAFLALFMTWFWEGELFDSITSGNVAYELCRPVSLYGMWFVRGLAVRLSKTVLRCLPVLLLASLMPAPFRMTLPGDGGTAAWFLLSMVLAWLNVVAFGMLVYLCAFFTISAQGLKMMVTSLSEFLSGAVIPLPFLPDGIRNVVELLPFASMQNVPFLIYGGTLAGNEMVRSVGLQIFWLAVMVLAGRLLEARALRRVVIQGG